MDTIQIKDKQFTVSIKEQDIQKEVIRVASEINRDLAGKNPLFLSVLNGSFMFTADLLKHITIPCEISFVKLASYQGVTSTGVIKEVIGLNEDIAGRTVVIVEDIVDTGLTMQRLLDTLGTRNPEAIHIASLLVKPEKLKVDLNIERPKPENVKPRLIIDGINCKDKENVKTLDDVDLTVNTGEILGIAGISGSGQKELLEAIAGLQNVESGSIRLLDDNGGEMELSGMDSISINEAGISLAFVPEDRIGMGLVGDMDMTDNMMIRSYRNGKGPFLDRKGPRALAEKIKNQLEVMTPSISAPVRQMSGGNVQKVLVGREIAQNPKVLLVAFPTRGVDINTSHVIYQLLNEQKKKGVAVVCVIEDLDVVLELCDRIAVLCGGKISGVVDGRTATKEGIGLLMTKHEKGGVVNE